MPDLTIRKAEVTDADLVITFIHALAKYEKLEGPDREAEARLRDHGWGDARRFEVLLAFEGDTPAGFALYFYPYSTFTARPTLYLEDLFVYPEYRGRGYGKSLLIELARVAAENSCGRMDWMVLDWNDSAIKFYEGLGAEIKDRWKLCRLEGTALSAMATE